MRRAFKRLAVQMHPDKLRRTARTGPGGPGGAEDEEEEGVADPEALAARFQARVGRTRLPATTFPTTH